VRFGKIVHHNNLQHRYTCILGSAVGRIHTMDTYTVIPTELHRSPHDVCDIGHFKQTVPRIVGEANAGYSLSRALSLLDFHNSSMN